MQSVAVDIVGVLRGLRVSPGMREADLHGEILRMLWGAGIGVEHEVVLGRRCRVDFLAGEGVAIEVKVGKRWTSQMVLRQLERYARHGSVLEVVLVVEREFPGRQDLPF